MSSGASHKRSTEKGVMTKAAELREFILWGYIRRNSDYYELYFDWEDAINADDEETAFEIADRIRDTWLLKSPINPMLSNPGRDPFVHSLIHKGVYTLEEALCSDSKVISELDEAIRKKGIERTYNTFSKKRFLVLALDLDTFTSDPLEFLEQEVGKLINEHRKKNGNFLARPGIDLRSHELNWKALDLSKKRKTPTEISKLLCLTKDSRQHHKMGMQILAKARKYVKKSPFLALATSK